MAYNGTMNARHGIAILLVAVLLVAALLGGCVAPQKTVKPGEPPPDPLTVRLPVGTPLKIEQNVPPPGVEQMIAPTEFEEGRTRALKLFQIDLGHIQTGPAECDSPPGPDESRHEQLRPAA